MFGQDKTTTQTIAKRGAPTKDTGVTILTSGCHFTGKLFCRGATRIGGTIEGQVIAEGLLVVEEDAIITGEVDAEDIVIHGRVDGKIDGRNRIEFCSTANVHAEVSTPSLVVHDGALFNGKTTMKRKAVAQSQSDGASSGKGFKFMGAKHKDTTDNSTKTLPDIKAARSMEDYSSQMMPEPSV